MTGVQTCALPIFVTYVVQAGDTLEAIAKQLDVSVSALASANGIVNRDELVEGQVLQVPPTAPTTTNPGQA